MAVILFHSDADRFYWHRNFCWTALTYINPVLKTGGAPEGEAYNLAD